MNTLGVLTAIVVFVVGYAAGVFVTTYYFERGRRK